MSDPAVTAYLTKLLCTYGGSLERNQLCNALDLPLPAEEIEQILQNEPLRFPQIDEQILARNPLRICPKYLNPKEEEEETCPKLHLCRDYLRGLCLPNRRPRCRFSHDVFSDHNHAVLNAHELDELNEEEIKVLLFQNDHQLLPENCRKYMSNNCDQGEDCTRHHVCIYFIRGECRNCACKKSHNLLESKVLLTCSWLSQETIHNFQMLCVVKHSERQQAQRVEPRNEEFGGMRGKSRGRGRGRNRRGARSQDKMKDRSKERRNKGSQVCRQSDRRQPSQRTRGQHYEAEYSEKRYGENDYDDRNSEARLESLMEEWFSPDTTSRYAPEFPSVPFNIPNKVSIAPILSHKSGLPQTRAPYPTTEKTRTDDSCQVGDSDSLSTPMIPRKEASLHQPTPPTGPNKATLETHPSTTSPRPLPASSTVNSSSGVPSTHLKPLMGSARLPSPPTASSTSAIMANKLINTSIKASFSPEPGIIPSRISAKSSLVSIKSDSRQRSQCTKSQRLEDDGENDYGDKNSETSLDHIMGEWFSSNTASSYAHESSRAPFHIPNTSSVAPIISHKSSHPQTHVPYPTTEKTKTETSCQVRYSIPSTKPMIPPRKEASPHQPTVPTAPNKPILKSGASTTSPSPLTSSSTVIHSSSGGPSTHLKSLTGSTSPPTVSSTSALTSNNLRNSAIDVLYSPRPGIAPSIISAKPSLVSSKSENYSRPSTLSQTPVKKLGDQTFNGLATWTNDVQPSTKKDSSSIPSSEHKNVYLSNPTIYVPLTAENKKDILSCQKIKETDHHRMESVVHWSLSFPDSDKLKVTSGSTKSDTNNLMQRKADATLKAVNYPSTWDIKAVPALGHQNILLPQTCDEFIKVTNLFNKTVTGHVVQKVWRIQNPTLWRAYQRQKDQMKMEKPGINVQEFQLFQSTVSVSITTICRDNFDWRVNGTNSMLYGRGNYFARDASYAHKYSVGNPEGTRTMFVARVLVGDFVKGEPTMVNPPQKYTSSKSYDCCVNSITNPSIFVVFEKSQAYPEYVLEYKREKKSACNIS